MLKTRKITDKIVLVSASSQEELCRTFMRFQEHYEGVEFRGKVFTEGQYNSWYSGNSESGAASYHRDVMGFNIPSSTLRAFIQGLFDPLTRMENELVSLFRYRTDDFYLIGVQEDPKLEFSALEHEICHGLWFTEWMYRTECLTVLNSYRHQLGPIQDYLRSKLYHPDVFDDECHAFISADLDWLAANRGVDALHLKPAQVQLRAIREKFKIPVS